MHPAARCLIVGADLMHALMEVKSSQVTSIKSSQVKSSQATHSIQCKSKSSQVKPGQPT